MSMFKNVLAGSVQSALVLTLANVLTREMTGLIEKAKKEYERRQTEKEELVLPEE